MNAAESYSQADLAAWRDTLSAEIDMLRRRQKEDAERERRLRLDRDRISHLLRNGRGGGRRERASHDDFYARSEEVAPFVRAWRRGEGNTLRTLSERAGVNIRTITRILNPADLSYNEFMTWDTAERLLAAVDREDALRELAMVPKSVRDRAAGEKSAGGRERAREQAEREAALLELTGY